MSDEQQRLETPNLTQFHGAMMAEFQRINGICDEMEAHLHVMQKMRDGLQMYLDEIKAVHFPPVEPSPATETECTPRPDTIAGIAYRMLDSYGESMSTDDMADLVGDDFGRDDLTSKKIRDVINKNHLFVRVGRSTFALRKWSVQEA